MNDVSQRLATGALDMVWYDGQPCCYFEKIAIALPSLLSLSLGLRLRIDSTIWRPW